MDCKNCHRNSHEDWSHRREVNESTRMKLIWFRITEHPLFACVARSTDILHLRKSSLLLLFGALNYLFFSLPCSSFRLRRSHASDHIPSTNTRMTFDILFSVSVPFSRYSHIKSYTEYEIMIIPSVRSHQSVPTHCANQNKHNKNKTKSVAANVSNTHQKQRKKNVGAFIGSSLSSVVCCCECGNKKGIKWNMKSFSQFTHAHSLARFNLRFARWIWALRLLPSSRVIRTHISASHV